MGGIPKTIVKSITSLPIKEFMLKIRVPLGDFFQVGEAKIYLDRDTENRVAVSIDAPKTVKVLRSKLVKDLTKVTMPRKLDQKGS